MADIRTNTADMTPEEWALLRKEVARKQFSRIPSFIDKLFSQNDITNFLRLLSRFPYYNYINLLIILNDRPDATFLAMYSNWKTAIVSTNNVSKILKPGEYKKPVDLVVPFTDTKGDRHELTWYSVMVFDVRQTNTIDFKSPKNVYVMDGRHHMLIQDAVTAVISSKYSHRVIFDPDTQYLQNCGLSGRMTANTVTIRRDLNDNKALLWLSEALCELSLQDAKLSSQCRRLLIQCAQFCLYGIWEIPHPGIVSGSHAIIPLNEQALFLDALQKTVFWLNQSVAGFYNMYRKDEAYEDDFEPPSFTSLSK